MNRTFVLASHFTECETCELVVCAGSDDGYGLPDIGKDFDE
jgi:hypothetical protein